MTYAPSPDVWRRLHPRAAAKGGVEAGKLVGGQIVRGVIGEVITLDRRVRVMFRPC